MPVSSSTQSGMALLVSLVFLLLLSLLGLASMDSAVQQENDRQCPARQSLIPGCRNCPA